LVTPKGQNKPMLTNWSVLALQAEHELSLYLSSYISLPGKNSNYNPKTHWCSALTSFPPKQQKNSIFSIKTEKHRGPNYVLLVWNTQQVAYSMVNLWP
jgi:hypothetical protein